MEMVEKSAPTRFEIYLVELDPTRGSEIRKTRPCVVVSPDITNSRIKTVIIAPMTSGAYPYPTRVPILFKKTQGHILLDQLRTVDKRCLLKYLGVLDNKIAVILCAKLEEMFAY